MASNDLISIIVPVYKVEQYLPKCIDSILAQTYTNFELILVDDGSPDNCGKICDDYAQKDNRVRVIHKENAGVSAARNDGISIAKGAYIGLIDSDDYVQPNLYECLYHAIKAQDADLSICDFQYVDEKGENLDVATKIMIQEDTISGKGILQHDALSVFWIVPWNKLYKRELFETVRYPLNMRFEDEYIIHQLLIQCDKIAIVRQKLLFYVQQQTSFTKKAISKENFNGVYAQLNRAEDLFTYRIYGKALYKTLISAILILCETYQALKKNDPETRGLYCHYRSWCRALITKLMKTKPGAWGLILILLYAMPCFGSRIIGFLKNHR